jgi:hypothetical protein
MPRDRDGIGILCIHFGFVMRVSSWIDGGRMNAVHAVLFRTGMLSALDMSNPMLADTL